MQNQEKETQKGSGRTIKFRAWDNADIPFYTVQGNDRMSYYGPEFRMDDQYNTLSFHTPDGFNSPAGDRESMERFTLMQFTGLKDKNGKEIYEGDILKWTHPNFKELKKEYKILEMSDIRKSLMLEPDCRNGWTEIIGNIYENPDLASQLNKE